MAQRADSESVYPKPAACPGDRRSQERPHGVGITSEWPTIRELSRGGPNGSAECGQFYGERVKRPDKWCSFRVKPTFGNEYDLSKYANRGGWASHSFCLLLDSLPLDN